MLSASAVAASISDEHPPASFPVWAAQPQNVVTREIPAWQRKRIAFLRATVLMHLHYSWIKYWLSALVQDKKYSLSYKLGKFLFCHCYKTKKCSLSLLFCYLINTFDSLNWSNITEGTAMIQVITPRMISRLENVLLKNLQSWKWQICQRSFQMYVTVVECSHIPSQL